MMEKYGVEETKKVEKEGRGVSEKFASERSDCEHPSECIVEEDGVKFCEKCEKYLR